MIIPISPSDDDVRGTDGIGAARQAGAPRRPAEARPILELRGASSHASGSETPLRGLDLSVAAMILGTSFRDPAAVLTRLLDGARPRHEG
jgi:hypothetical protein